MSTGWRFRRGETREGEDRTVEARAAVWWAVVRLGQRGNGVMSHTCDVSKGEETGSLTVKVGLRPGEEQSGQVESGDVRIGEVGSGEVRQVMSGQVSLAVCCQDR